MEIEKKYMSRPRWRRVLEKEYVTKNIEKSSQNISIGLIHILKLTEPFYKMYNDKKIKIADRGFYWLQIGIENENYWITAVYNENKKFIQCYIDITLKNVINKNEDSYFLDLFLDVVKLNTGEIFLLDENELEDALKEKVITKEEYNLAYNTAEKIKKVLISDKNYIEKICDEYFNLLIKDF